MAKSNVIKPKISVRDSANMAGRRELSVLYDKDKTEYTVSFTQEPETQIAGIKQLFEYICQQRLGFIEFDLIKAAAGV